MLTNPTRKVTEVEMIVELKKRLFLANQLIQLLTDEIAKLKERDDE